MKLLVIDGNSLINRAYYGVRPLTTREGVFTNAVFGFSTILLKLIADVSPDGVAVAFDLRAPTFRHKMYDAYKAGRKPMPEELFQQFPLVRELIGLWGFTAVDCEGFEADDILGTLAGACRKDENDTCVIATGDRDSLQLVGDGVKVYLAKTSGGKAETVVYDDDAIMAQYGVTPKRLIDVKAIMGDTSDNIPGVAGIGEKGATALIAAYGSLDGVYENIDDKGIKDGMRKKLIESKDSAYMSRTLAEISDAAPIDTELEHYRIRPVDAQGMTTFLTKLEMFSLIPRIVGTGAAEIASKSSEKVAIVEESPVGDTLYFAPSEDGIYVACPGGVTKTGVGELLAAAARGAALCTADTKAACAAGIGAESISFDCSLAAYLLNPSSADYGIDRLCREYGVTEFESDIPAAKIAAALPELSEVLGKKIDENGQRELLCTMEIPLAGVLYDMETVGFRVDCEGITAFGERLTGELKQLEENIYTLANGEFNINSPKQLGEVLFERLGLPVGKKTKSGYSTDAAVLDSLRDTHPIIEQILSYRQLAKLKSTYCDGLIPKIAADGRLHSSFNQTETRTGRISSAEPNLQNIPVRSVLGRELRRFFIPADGCKLVDADYSQIELRVLAHIADDEEMKRAFREGVDIHTLTASQVMGLPPLMVTKEMRSAAKAVNFGIVYGISAFSLARDIHTSRKQAEEYINGYMRTYSGVKRYMEETVRKAREDGCVTTILGRKRLLPELSASNFNTRSFGERVSRNMPIQGAAADIIKLAMIRVSDALRDAGLAARLILQVHDELIIEAPDNEVETVREILRTEMENAFPMSVPLVTDISVGSTWYECK